RGDRRPVRLIYRAAARASMIAPEEIARRAGALDFAAVYSARDGAGDARFETGRPDQAMLRRVLGNAPPERAIAMICGPGAMMATVADALSEMGMPLSHIRDERFDYGDETRSAKDRSVMRGFHAMALATLAAMVAFTIR